MKETLVAIAYVVGVCLGVGFVIVILSMLFMGAIMWGGSR